MRVTAILTAAERKRQDRSVHRAEERRRRAKMMRVCGPTCPHSSVWAHASAVQAPKRLINKRKLAILTSNGMPLGECRTVICSNSSSRLPTGDLRIPRGTAAINWVTMTTWSSPISNVGLSLVAGFGALDLGKSGTTTRVFRSFSRSLWTSRMKPSPVGLGKTSYFGIKTAGSCLAEGHASRHMSLSSSTPLHFQLSIALSWQLLPQYEPPALQHGTGQLLIPLPQRAMLHQAIGSSASAIGHS